MIYGVKMLKLLLFNLKIKKKTNCSLSCRYANMLSFGFLWILSSAAFKERPPLTYNVVQLNHILRQLRMEVDGDTGWNVVGRSMECTRDT